MRWLLGLAVVLALTPSAQATARSGLVGTVRRGPITPVCFENRPCDEPAANVTIVFTRNGRATRVRTTRLGWYRVMLAPGVYRVRTAVPTSIGSGIQPGHVRVRAGRHTRVNFSIDTGIR